MSYGKARTTLKCAHCGQRCTAFGPNEACNPHRDPKTGETCKGTGLSIDNHHELIGIRLAGTVTISKP